MMLPDAHCGAGRAAGLGKVHLPETDGGERTVVGRDPQIAGGRRDEPDDSRTGLPDAALPVGATFGDRAAGDVHRRHQPDAGGAGAVSGDWPRLGMRSGSGILRRAARRLPGTECGEAARGTGRGAGENGREAGAAVGGRGVHAGDGAAGGIAGPAVREGFEFRSDRQGRKTTPSGPGGADPLVRAGRPRPAADTTTSASCGAPAGRRGRRPRTRGGRPTNPGGPVFHGISRAEGPFKQARRPVLLHAAIFATVWLLVSAVQVLPAIEYAKQSLRWAGAPEPLRWGQPVPYAVHAQYSLGWPSVGGIVLPGISLHANPHVGFVAVALALAALWYRWREPLVRWFAFVAVGGLLLALGKDFPPYWLIYRFVPMVERSEEHTSELQSLRHLVCRLLLE